MRSTNCTPRPCCWPVTRRGCDCWSTTCSRPCRGAAGHWSISSWQLIDRLERNEEDPDRLDSLFRLDHLAARLRRNSANLLVLAGAQLARDQREPGTAGDGDQRRRFRGRGLPPRRNRPGCPSATLIGAAAGAAIHLFAELIDNALRYSPPTTSVRVSGGTVAATEGVLVRIADAGLGMNDADRRIANMRLAGRRRGHPRQCPPHGSFRGRPDRRPARYPGRAARPGAARGGLRYDRRDLPAADGARGCRLSGGGTASTGPRRVFAEHQTRQRHGDDGPRR